MFRCVDQDCNLTSFTIFINTTMRLTKSFFVTVLVLALLAGGVYVFETYVIASPTPKYSPTNSVYDVLLSNNTLFALGETLASQGNMTDAKAAYEKALSTATDSFQEGVINFKLAIIQWQTDPIGSIPALEAIAVNPDYAPSTRAYALQYIGQAYNNPPIPLSPDQIQQLVATTFASGPFAAMLTGGDTSLAYRNIYDIADALYPLPLPESMEAHWYAIQLLAPSVSSTTAAAYLSQISDDSSAMMRAIQTESIDPNLAIFSARALEDRADTERVLFNAGYVSSSDVVALYKGALNAFTAIPNIATRDGFARYNYAIFLSYAFASSQASEVQSILAPIDTSPAYATAPLGFFLKRLHGSTSYLHSNAVLVARADPKFKSFLMSLGWTADDFPS